MAILEIDYLTGWREALGGWTVPGSAAENAAGEDDGWAQMAERFRAISQSFRPERDPLFERLAPRLGRQVTVLEIGPGAGRLTLPVAARTQKVIAVEASTGMRRVLADEAAARGLGNLEIVAGRWPAVSVPSVDLAFCSHVLYDVAEVGPFLSQLNAAARRACFVYMTVCHPLASFRDLWEVFRGWSPPARPTYLDAAQCLFQLGIFPNVEVSILEEGLSFAGPDEGVAFARRRLGLPEDAAAEARLRDYLVARGRWKNGRWYPHFQMDKVAVLWWEKRD